MRRALRRGRSRAGTRRRATANLRDARRPARLCRPRSRAPSFVGALADGVPVTVVQGRLQSFSFEARAAKPKGRPFLALLEHASQACLNQRAHGSPAASRFHSGGLEQRVGNLYGRLHTYNNIIVPISMSTIDLARLRITLTSRSLTDAP